MVRFGGRIDKERFPDFHRLSRARIRRCLEPRGKCTSRAIRAHSIQNARFLRSLEKDGHVFRVASSATLETGLDIDFRRVGCKEATTFTGLCARHDNEIFAPIEKTELDLDDAEHLFLMAYRAALHELHSQLEAAMKVQGGYVDRVKRALDPGDGPSPAGILATERLCVAYETYLYKSELDTAYLSKDFTALHHDIVRLNVTFPTVATCSVFSTEVEDQELLIHLNVLPLSPTETVAVFSYLDPAGRYARRFLRPILKSNGTGQQHELSRLILGNCENFVLSPAYVDTWTAEKKEVVLRYFIRTMWENDLECNLDLLNLFVGHT